jgi:hypothetical protein
LRNGYISSSGGARATNQSNTRIGVGVGSSSNVNSTRTSNGSTQSGNRTDACGLSNSYVTRSSRACTTVQSNAVVAIGIETSSRSNCACTRNNSTESSDRTSCASNFSNVNSCTRASTASSRAEGIGTSGATGTTSRNKNEETEKS